MNEQHIEDIITTLYDMIQDAKSLPLAADKCILERDKALDLLDEIISLLPVELKQSRTIVESRNELIGQAQENANRMVSQEAIYQEAKRQCQEMLLQTQSRMAELRRVSNEYMDDALMRTEEAMAQALAEVRDTHTKFKALAEAQEKKSAIDTEV